MFLVFNFSKDNIIYVTILVPIKKKKKNPNQVTNPHHNATVK